MYRSALSYFLFLAVAGCWLLVPGGCAQIGFPTGGPRDTIPPRLQKAIPPEGSLHFSSRKIVFHFDEYVEVKDLFANLFVSPPLKSNPSVSSNLRTVTLTFKDTLAPNTTYNIQFGSAIRDLNEGNPLNGFHYVFSTGDVIDSLTLSGRVVLAETGETDSTLTVMLYRNLHDSAVTGLRPDFVARINSAGEFHFTNLPAGTFRLYALKDEDGSRTYNSPKEVFAFYGSEIRLPQDLSVADMYAYAEEKKADLSATPKVLPEKRLRSAAALFDNKQDVSVPLTVSFNNPLVLLDTQKIILSDTGYMKLSARFGIDSSRTRLTVYYPWVPGSGYRLVIPKESVSDSGSNSLLKNDTIAFRAFREEEYGRVLLRLTPAASDIPIVIQLLQGNEVKYASAVTGGSFSNKRVLPGEYTIRLLFDSNGNGKWDPGSFSKGIQPEKAITIKQRLSVRGDWDNERDISY